MAHPPSTRPAAHPELTQLALYAQAYPPAAPWQQQARAVVHQSANTRWALVREGHDDATAGLVRAEQLAELGLFDADVDARQFARGLVDALAPQLSLCELEALVAAFQNELWQQGMACQRHHPTTAGSGEA